MDTMKENILMWFATGQVGTSSKAMVLAVLDFPQDPDWPDEYPYHPVELNGCLLLLEAAPEIRDHMDKVAALSERWARLVARWDELEKCFLDECGLDWSKGYEAHWTYKLMREILEC